MTGDVNAAIEDALLGGAIDVLVNDSHDGMRTFYFKLTSGFPSSDRIHQRVV